MKDKFVRYYLGIAQLTSKLSYAKRLQVGAVIAKDDHILGTGYNGTPTMWDNNCENRQYWDRIADERLGIHFDSDFIVKKFPHKDDNGNRYNLVTKPEVIHAEMNCILKVAKSTESTEGSTMFCTHAPCVECAKMILQSGINTIWYLNSYRDTSGIDLLVKGKLNVYHYDKSI